MIGEPVSLGRCDDPTHENCVVWNATEIIGVHIPMIEAAQYIRRQQQIDHDFHERERARRQVEAPRQRQPFAFY